MATSLGWAGCASNPPAGAAASRPATTTASRLAGAAAPASPTGGPATAQQKLADWVTALVNGDYLRACTDMADSAVSPTRPFTAAQCTRGAAGYPTLTMEYLLKNISHLFIPKNPTHPTEVRVTGQPVTGGSTVITADEVTVDGQRLDRVIAAARTPDDILVNTSNQPFGLTKLGGIWYCVSSESLA